MCQLARHQAKTVPTTLHEIVVTGCSNDPSIRGTYVRHTELMNGHPAFIRRDALRFLSWTDSPHPSWQVTDALDGGGAVRARAEARGGSVPTDAADWKTRSGGEWQTDVTVRLTGRSAAADTVRLA